MLLAENPRRQALLLLDLVVAASAGGAAAQQHLCTLRALRSPPPSPPPVVGLLRLAIIVTARWGSAAPRPPLRGPAASPLTAAHVTVFYRACSAPAAPSERRPPPFAPRLPKFAGMAAPAACGAALPPPHVKMETRPGPARPGQEEEEEESMIYPRTRDPLKARASPPPGSAPFPPLPRHLKNRKVTRAPPPRWWRPASPPPAEPRLQLSPDASHTFTTCTWPG